MNLKLLHRHLEGPEGARRASRRFLLVLGVAMLLLMVGVTVGAVFLVKWLIALMPHRA
jgi:Tfp pilus assembly protein PilN